MGACQSCLGLERRDSAPAPSETSRLLSEDPFQPPYGTAGQSRDFHASGPPQPDPEQLKQERDALERIFAQTSDKLIDVSQTSHAEVGSKLNIDYARLFREAFPAISKPNPKSPNGDDPETAEDNDNGEEAWLRKIIMQDPSGQSWNCNHVREITKPLVFNFDDFTRNPAPRNAIPAA